MKFSNEHRRKLSESHKGTKLSEETINKMRGRTPWNKGKKLSEEHKQKLRVPHIGSGIYKHKPLSKEHIKRIIESRKWYKHSEESKKKMGLSKIGNLNPMKRLEVRIKNGLSKKGKKLSEETKRKISEHHKKFGIGKWMKGRNVGKNCRWWKGGIEAGIYEGQKLRKSAKYIYWTKEIYKKDDYRCFDCGEKKGKLNAHHIYSFSKCPRLRFDLNNGITLCINCHKLRHIFFGYSFIC